MVAHRCQIKKNKNNWNKSKRKNENKEIEKMKKMIQKKNPQNYHGPWVPNLILSYQTLYIAKYGFFLIASKNFSPWDSGTDRGTGGD